MSFRQRFLVLLAVVSALLPLSTWLLVKGLGDAEPLAVLGGTVGAALALFGLLALARVVIVVEQGRSRR